MPPWLVPASFVLGVLFLAVLLALTVNPKAEVSAFDQRVRWAILSLMIAACSAALLGRLAVRLDVKRKLAVVAAGPMGVFVIVFLIGPLGGEKLFAEHPKAAATASLASPAAPPGNPERPPPQSPSAPTPAVFYSSHTEGTANITVQGSPSATIRQTITTSPAGQAPSPARAR
ncbi:MAG TPA: hypothetical protein VFS43_00500 [Polyangiaceae bacterium]|nr:hypothetical protein [Polyangiaceae bacterium]